MMCKRFRVPGSDLRSNYTRSVDVVAVLLGEYLRGLCLAWNSLNSKAEQSLGENVFRLILDKIYYADKSWKEISF